MRQDESALRLCAILYIGMERRTALPCCGRGRGRRQCNKRAIAALFLMARKAQDE